MSRRLHYGVSTSLQQAKCAKMGGGGSQHVPYAEAIKIMVSVLVHDIFGARLDKEAEKDRTFNNPPPKKICARDCNNAL